MSLIEIFKMLISGKDVGITEIPDFNPTLDSAKLIQYIEREYNVSPTYVHRSSEELLKLAKHSNKNISVSAAVSYLVRLFNIVPLKQMIE
jgi:hypothetical protein